MNSHFITKKDEYYEFQKQPNDNLDDSVLLKYIKSLQYISNIQNIDPKNLQELIDDIKESISSIQAVNLTKSSIENFNKVTAKDKEKIESVLNEVNLSILRYRRILSSFNDQIKCYNDQLKLIYRECPPYNPIYASDEKKFKEMRAETFRLYKRYNLNLIYQKIENYVLFAKETTSKIEELCFIKKQIANIRVCLFSLAKLRDKRTLRANE